MRFSGLVAVLLLAGCAREQKPPFRRLVVLPIEDLTANASASADAEALQLAVWESLQAQPALHAVMAGHRRELAGSTWTYLVEGYAAAGRFHLQCNGKALECAGTLGDCASRLAGEVAKQVGVTARPVPSADSLRSLVRPASEGVDLAGLEKAAAADPSFSSIWLRWASEAQSQGGAPAALAILKRAPIESMSPYDAARLRLGVATFQQDRVAHARAMVDLAGISLADIELQERAAREISATRDFAAGQAIYERLLALSPAPRYYNQAAYLAAFRGDKANAERYAGLAQSAAPNDPTYTDTRGEIAYYFSDFPEASRYFEQAAGINPTFQGGLDLWKAAYAARKAGDTARADAMFARYLDFKSQAGLRNTLLLQAVWDWHGDQPEAAMEKLRLAENTTERGKSLFLQSLIALNRRDFSAVQSLRQRMELNAIESAFLRSLTDGTAPPPGFPFPADAVSALHSYLRGDTTRAKAALASARSQMDPFTDGQWRKLDALLNGRKPEGMLPVSPDDWLAILLH